MFSASVPSCSAAKENSDTTFEDDEVQTIFSEKRPRQSIAEALRAKSPWESDGEKTLRMNKRIMEFIAVDLQPLSVVENIGFQRLVTEMQPKYVMPGRKFFTNTLMPQIV
ncbi:hypothetical protein niasHT_012224 [Heterodera trifolii]|uniref:Uncharacterized protein n=1 Tax=Heterodera trifolii TaxID=157864 RepID=A0ABD2KXZ6_9BILA